MIQEKLYLKNGILLSNSYNRVVHGKRGDYIELELEHFEIPLIEKFNHLEDDVLVKMGHYYAWLFPEGNQFVKIYKQVRTVSYADYKVGKYYISPEFILNFKDPEKLF